MEKMRDKKGKKKYGFQNVRNKTLQPIPTEYTFCQIHMEKSPR